MAIANTFTPAWGVHPGEILEEDFLKPLNISPYKLAQELHVAPPTVNQIVRKQAGISTEMAARLAKFFGTTEQFWLNLHDAYEVHEFKATNAKKLAAIRPLPMAAGVRMRKG